MRKRPSGGEILRTYLIWWLLGPLIICGPLALAVWWLNSDNDAGVMTALLLMGCGVAWMPLVGASMWKRYCRERGLPEM
ncbi:hypothetical protein [Streptomyces sp. NPDC019890]|uniref:hypothetical protein n=1 Tax=Streptomyces sp. NPDC019890 TaxID=3365064 RepID=UPI00384EFA5E